MIALATTAAAWGAGGIVCCWLLADEAREIVAKADRIRRLPRVQRLSYLG